MLLAHLCSIVSILPAQIISHPEHGKYRHEGVGPDGELILDRGELIARGEHVLNVRLVVSAVDQLVVFSRFSSS